MRGSRLCIFCPIFTWNRSFQKALLPTEATLHPLPVRLAALAAPSPSMASPGEVLPAATSSSSLVEKMHRALGP